MSDKANGAGPVLGDIITIGSYWQRKSGVNGEEAIVWRVLETRGEKALLLADKALEVRPYHLEKTAVTWENCSLRKWLNSEFVNEAFTAAEQERILLSDIVNNRHPEYGTHGGNDTRDKVFLLSWEDIVNPAYGFLADALSEDPQRAAKGTDYLKRSSTNLDDNGYALWWLRSCGERPDSASVVCHAGYALGVFTVNNRNIGVRPAFWLAI